jgi:hypothetical protein
LIFNRILRTTPLIKLGFKMKNYLFTLFLLVFLLAFGCSDKKTSPAKTGDSPKPIATLSVSDTESQPLIEQEKPNAPAQKQNTSSLQPHVSGSSPHVSGTSTQRISGIQNHVSGQPRYSPSISGSQSHVSGRVTRPHISGQ